MNNASAQGAKRRLAFAFLAIVWLFKLVLGLADAARRHVPDYSGAVKGFPNIGQVEFYIVIPATMLALNLLMLAFASKTLRWLAILVAALQIILLIMLLIFSTGGI